MGTVLDLHISFGYVLSHNSKTEKLQAADKDDHADNGSPALNRIIKDQFSYNNKKKCKERESGHGSSKPGSNSQGSLGKINDAADCIFKKLPEIPLRFTGYTLDILIWEPICTETDPSEDSFGETVVFAH